MAFNIKMTMNSYFSDYFCYHKIQDNNGYTDVNDRLPEKERILFIHCLKRNVGTCDYYNTTETLKYGINLILRSRTRNTS